jgi:hypothetical protein
MFEINLGKEDRMQLKIKRNQRETKGLLFGSNVEIELAYSVNVSTEERTLLEKYGMKNLVLFSRKLPHVEKEVNYTASDLINGNTFKSPIKGDINSFANILEIEESIIDAAKKLKMVLTVLESFGGESVIEIE